MNTRTSRAFIPGKNHTTPGASHVLQLALPPLPAGPADFSSQFPAHLPLPTAARAPGCIETHQLPNRGL